MRKQTRLGPCTMRLPREIWDALGRLSERTELSRSDLVSLALGLELRVTPSEVEHAITDRGSDQYDCQEVSVG